MSEKEAKALKERIERLVKFVEVTAEQDGPDEWYLHLVWSVKHRGMPDPVEHEDVVWEEDDWLSLAAMNHWPTE